MRPVEIKTYIETKTTVSYKGEDINELLKDLCASLHSAFYCLNDIREKYNLPEDAFESFEGELCHMLDKLDD